MPYFSQFVARVYNRFFKMKDVAAQTFTALTPWARFNFLTGDIEGASVPAPTSPLVITANSPTETPFTIVGAPGQTGDFFHMKFANGATRLQVSLYQTVITSDVVLGGVVYMCGNTVGFNASGSAFRAGYAFNWTDGNTIFDSTTTTRFGQIAPGILRVQNLLTGNDGGIVQRGLYFAPANTPAATTLGNIVGKYTVYNSDGTVRGYSPIYDSIN